MVANFPEVESCPFLRLRRPSGTGRPEYICWKLGSVSNSLLHNGYDLYIHIYYIYVYIYIYIYVCMYGIYIYIYIHIYIERERVSAHGICIMINT